MNTRYSRCHFHLCAVEHLLHVAATHLFAFSPGIRKIFARLLLCLFCCSVWSGMSLRMHIRYSFMVALGATIAASYIIHHPPETIIYEDDVS